MTDQFDPYRPALTPESWARDFMDRPEPTAPDAVMEAMKVSNYEAHDRLQEWWLTPGDKIEVHFGDDVEEITGTVMGATSTVLVIHDDEDEDDPLPVTRIPWTLVRVIFSPEKR